MAYAFQLEQRYGPPPPGQREVDVYDDSNEDLAREVISDDA